MTVGVDDVSEKLSGIVNLLQIVGIDGVDPNALVEEQKRLASGKKDGSSAGTGTTAQSSDSQILEIIKKLQMAQADSPEILQALQSPELLALASLAAQNKAPAPAPTPSLQDVMDEEEDNYPKIGPGYSDEISVISEMSTPTVMTKQNVNEEEYYNEVGGGAPPMSIGGRPPTSIGGGGGGRGKSRNLLATVANRGALAKGGGAAAQRRANYQTTMAKLQEPEKDDKKGKSQKGKGKKASDKKKKKKDHDDKSKSSKGSKGDGIDWGNSGDDAGWPSFEQFDTTFGEDPFGTTSATTEKVVDDDGFFANDVFANVDAFSQQPPAPNASSNSSQASSSKKDGKKKKPKKPKDDGQGTRNRTEKPKEKPKTRRTRRASMGM